jgi:hypothetical protein
VIRATDGVKIMRIRRQPPQGVMRPFQPALTTDVSEQVADALEAIAHTLSAIDHNLEALANSVGMIAQQLPALIQKR